MARVTSPQTRIASGASVAIVAFGLTFGIWARTSRSVITTKCHGCVLFALGALIAAARILWISSSGTGLSWYLRMLRRVWIASSASIVFLLSVVGLAPRPSSLAPGPSQLLDADVAEKDLLAVPVGVESDTSFFVLQAGVLLAVDGRDLVEIGVDDDRAVERHLHVAAVADDLLAVPLACLLGVTLLGRDDAVDRAVVLVGLQVKILGVRRIVVAGALVVEHLDFHAVQVRLAADLRADAHAVIAVLLQLDLEAEDEIGVLLLGEDVVVAVCLADEQAAF